MAINNLDTKKQSEQVIKQHGELWRKHAREHSKYAPFKSLEDFQNSGVGRALVIVANGASFEEQIDVLKEHKNSVDILCCDKTLGHLLNHGIKPTFCLIADAKVNYEKYMEPWKDQLDRTILFMNVTANPKWSGNGNWKDKYFFVNFDVLRTEVEFSAISGCQNLIAAATNVSNAMVVFATQSDNKARRNFFGYDKILLVGFDYSWKPDGNYYSFDKTGNGKHNYMRHVYAVNRQGEIVFTSTNLLFSAKWLENYLQIFKLPIVNCSVGGILGKVKSRPLVEQLPYSFKPAHRDIVRSDMKRREALAREMQGIENSLRMVGEMHWNNFIQTTI